MELGARRVLVLAPHTDDGELGAGGTIARLVDDGADVRYLAFSSAEDSLAPEYPSDILVKEVRQAVDVLGLAPHQLEILDYQVRRLGNYRQDILDHMIAVREDFRPDLVLMPSTRDIHQDHVVVANEGIRAYKYSMILAYEIPWNQLNFTASAFVTLQSHHVESKVQALNCYVSQKARPYMNEEFVRSQARFRGVQVGSRYAEAFEIVRVVF